MFVIDISAETLPEIFSRELKFNETQRSAIESIYAAPQRSGKWNLISGYVTSRGHFLDWTILPVSKTRHELDFDHSKAKTEWTLAVKK